MKHKDTIFFDAETTGLLKPEASLLVDQPHIIELYAVRMDHKGKVVDEFESFMSVPVEVPKHITKITGITGSMIADAPEFVENYRELVELYLGARRMVAHNLPFDSGMLWVELSRLGLEFQFPWPPEWYCTIEHSMHIQSKRLKLGVLHKELTGEDFIEGAHRAKQDVFAMIRCYQIMIEKGY